MSKYDRIHRKSTAPGKFIKKYRIDMFPEFPRYMDFPAFYVFYSNPKFLFQVQNINRNNQTKSICNDSSQCRTCNLHSWKAHVSVNQNNIQNNIQYNINTDNNCTYYGTSTCITTIFQDSLQNLQNP